ncbi:hypothetical protein [Mycolicibacterium fluoranthenivorans]|uniref:Uncharacterized protein n=1 Tax=Mycolicibacterium fluoranthenivorans TaxID=258505 RepID=A0A1G4X2N9_9MYCO|nr:hypothetical protein [Mycolicibacterium fluoranthenivorans]SCX34525.1 hypothetical protein SAMN02799620_06366 [Mycolicibacterium fluoranthenivorans]
MNRIRSWVQNAETPGPLLTVLFGFVWLLIVAICIPIAIVTHDWTPIGAYLVVLPLSAALAAIVIAFANWLSR